MTRKEEEINKKNKDITNEKKIEEIKSLKNIDNNTLIKSNSSSKNSKILKDNILHNLLNNNNNNFFQELDLKIDDSIEMDSLENIKQDIINFYLIEQKKNEEKKRELEINRLRNLNINNYNNLKSNLNNNHNTKGANKKQKEQNRFEKYDKEKLSYEIYHKYQKLNFEKEKLPFVKRMELYALKKCLKDYKIEELINMKSPKISEEKKIHTFNRLIEDSNRRNFNSYKNNSFQKKEKKNPNNKNNNQKNKKSTENKNNNIIKKMSNYNVNKSFDKKKWDEIYERRFSSKLKERNEKLEKMRQEKEEKIKKEEDLILDNLNKKQILINKKYGMKRSNSVSNLSKTKNNSFNNKYYIGNNKMITNLNQRLYYNELNKKDIDYKTFMDKAQELLNDNNNDYFYYYGRQDKNNNNNEKEGKNYHKKTNAFRAGTNYGKTKKMVKSNSVYTFKDYLDSNNENKKNEEKNFKIINGILDNHNFEKNNLDNTIKSDLQDLVNLNNISKEKNNSAEKIIDRFFEN